MTKYKVGDVAALFSKPKSPTTTGGKKLQSLFQDYYSKKSKHTFYPQETNSEINTSSQNKELTDQSAYKKSKKRKFSYSNDSELNENVSSKKFKKSSEQEEGVKNNEIKKLNFKRKKVFPRKNKQPKVNSFNFNEAKNASKNDMISPSESKFKKIPNFNFKELSEQEEDAKNNEIKKLKFKKKKDFPRKNKQSNFSGTFPTIEAKDIENDVVSTSPSKFKNMPNYNKKNKSFIKKSKKKSLEHNSNKLLNNISSKDSDDSEDALLKEEIKEFMHDNSGKKKLKRSSDNIDKEVAFDKKKRNSMGKQKKTFITNKGSSPQKYEISSEHDIQFEKANKKNNNQQDFPRTKKVSKANSFNFDNTESKTKYDDVEQKPSSKKLIFVEENNIKKSKKSKHALSDTYANSFSITGNSSEINTSKAKELTDFTRKPKNKKTDGIFSNDNVKKSSSKVFDNVNTDKNFKNEEFNLSNKMQKGQVREFGAEAPDFIRLSNSDDYNNEENSEERLTRTLFVGNLPKNISKQELRNLFSAFGAIEGIRVAGVETDKAKIFGRNPPKLLHSNYAADTVPAFIVFKDKKFAVEALKLSGSVFKGHHITVDFALPAGSHKVYDDKRSIFIGNLPFDVQDENIWNAFNHCGRIEGVRVIRDRQSGLGKGFGYVLFTTVEAKQSALALETVNVEGREIRIKAVVSNKKAQKKGPSTPRRDTFKSRAIRMKKNSKVTSGHKTIRKLTKKQKMIHKKKKTAEMLQKAMK